jgi:hypothetical protein
MFDELEYVFIRNTHCSATREILKKMNNFAMATTSNCITVNHSLIKKPFKQYTSMKIQVQS